VLCCVEWLITENWNHKLGGEGLDAGLRLVQKLVGCADHRSSQVVAKIAEEEVEEGRKRREEKKNVRVYQRVWYCN
jgi:hypothetical protein